MKKTLLTFIITFVFLSWNAQSQSEKEEKIRSKINSEFQENASNCNREINAITDVNGKTEFWSICNLEKGNRIITIESHEKETYFQEIYFEKNGKLIYAKETENYIPRNHFTQISWNCEFYTENGKLITLISLGHGKTENEEWNPEIIFDMYKNRLSELQQIKK
ncbi:hypothetical protein [Flavobacterium sp. J27]|uniref:hypothetical protein n=1 Tax=Flavobacterium sp. J27 TaxID=2060419 RepID=UPI001031EAB8|nr:hypothetical protein [Flavobacterium sp. J27]